MKRSVAIVGAGPSGCYLAQALLKRAPDLLVDVYDRLPTPYGLVRYGVAPDHQGTKAVDRQFDRVFTRQGARFFGDVEIGRDLPLDALRARYNAVVLATGLTADRRLDAPGAELAGVLGAGAFTRAVLEHPDAGETPNLGPRVVVVGAGNVAIDVVRLLAKTAAEFDGSDLGAAPEAALAACGTRSITLVARGPASAARFDAAMIKELDALRNVAISVDGAETWSLGDDPRRDALAALHGRGAGPVQLRFLFDRPVRALDGENGRVAAIVVDGPDGQERLPCDAVITAIGFDPGDAPAADADGRVSSGLYAVGWRARGARGALPDARADAQALADRLLADLEGAAPRETPPPPENAIDFDAWRRIDAAETAAARPGRKRAKLASRDALRAAAAATGAAPQ